MEDNVVFPLAHRLLPINQAKTEPSVLFRGVISNLLKFYFKVIGIRPLAPVQNSVSLKLMQRKTLNFVINLPGV